jgi:hypothetical protein
MTQSLSGCACGCNPCQCARPGANGCLTDFCVPRPSFFSGQLVTAEDLNAVVRYFMAKDALLAKLVAGWGILGGMRLQSSGAKSLGLIMGGDQSEEGEPPACVDEILPNPQIVAGSVIRVSAGAAIDNAGRTLTLCSPRDLDILQLSVGLQAAPETRGCGGWLGDFCGHLDGFFTATQYWVIAERVDTPTRPVPQFTGTGNCGPEQNCDFSRQFEDVRIRLVKDVPLLYFLHGCLDTIPLRCIDALVSTLFGTIEAIGDIGTALTGVASSELVARLLTDLSPSSTKTAHQMVTERFGCVGFKIVPQLLEFINDIAVTTCCANPAVVLGRVLLATTVPAGVEAALGVQPHYVIVDDAFPYRRIVPNLAMNQTFVTALESLLVCLSEHPFQKVNTESPQ